MDEQWRDICGFEGRYQISNKGRVKSLPFMQRYLLRNGVEAHRKTKEAILSIQVARHGYVLVHLHKDNHRVCFAVHALVARAFVAGSGRTINHIDGDKQNNCASNLEWVSYVENLNHAVDLGLNAQAIPVRSPFTGKKYPSIARAARQEHMSPKTVRKLFAVEAL